jgi:hypothetical protein
VLPEPSTGGPPARARHDRFPLVGGVALLAAVAAYLVVVPQAPDLAAQVARADVVRTLGPVVVWWPGWFAGLHLPTYSELSPLLMARLGAPVTGALATVVSVVCALPLLRGAVRPRLAAVALAGMLLLNLLDGRITFLVGVAFAVASLAVLRGGRRALALVLGALTCLASPLAALFLGIGALAVVATHRDHRRAAVGLAVVLAAAAGSLGLLFPGTGVMPAPANQILPAVAATVAVAVLCPQPAIRWASVLLAGASLTTLVVPSAVGQNITRMTWLLAAPVLIGYARGALPLLAVLTLGASSWSVVDVSLQVSYARDPSVQQAFYTPLLAELQAQRASAPVLGQRVEVVDPRSHGSDRYVAPLVPLARGWDRQADQVDNPLFYTRGALTPASYRAWLDELAVGWVAVPSGALDYASAAEARLIRAGQPYLQPVWRTAQWQLYAVRGAQPLATGATVTAVTADHVTLRTDGPATVRLAWRWSPYLAVGAPDAAADRDPAGCTRQDGAFTEVVVPAAGEYTVGAELDPRRREACPA